MSEDGRTQDGLVSLLAGIGVGALIGAATALLLAPQSGATTRQQLRERADDVSHNMRESLDELRHKLEDVVAQVRQRGEGEQRHGDVAQDTESS